MYLEHNNEHVCAQDGGLGYFNKVSLRADWGGGDDRQTAEDTESQPGLKTNSIRNPNLKP